MNEIEKNKYYSSQAINFMLENPARTVEFYIFKFINYFNYKNNIKTNITSFKTKELLVLVTYGILLSLLIVRLLLFRYKFTRFEVLLLSLYMQ